MAPGVNSIPRSRNIAPTHERTWEGSVWIMTDAPVRPDTSDMLAVHQVFRSALSPASELIATAKGDDTRRGLLNNYYDNILAFLEVHHEGEQELVFPILLERAPDQSELIERMTDQHENVVASIENARISLDNWGASGDAGADEAAAALKDLGDDLTEHLDEEETRILPLAAENMTVQEWGGLSGHGLRLFEGDKIWLILGLIRENMTQEQRDTMLVNMPPPARDMWETMGADSFERLIAEVRH